MADQTTTGTEWYKRAIIYALQVQTFYDSNDDGCGDFRGVIEKLDYLEELGVTCLWLLPFYKTATKDDGYDVVDHCAVDPRVGSEDDLRALLDEAHRRGLRVIIELIVDHTSDQHEWFLRAKDPASAYRDYYIWSDVDRHGPEVSGSIFPGEEDGVWTFDEEAGAYYFHLFYKSEPSLNNANPRVRQEIQHLIEHWSQLPIDGFRVDAASHILQDKPEKTLRDESFVLLTEICEAIKRDNPDRIAMAEADVDAEEYGKYFDSVQTMLNFLLSEYAFLGLAMERSGPIRAIVEYLATARKDGGQFINFLRNVDELDMERLHQEEQEVVNRAFAPEADQRIYGRGIRRRLAPMLGGNQRRIEMAYSLLFSLPGTPLLFWGDELGIGEDLSLPGRFAVRLPMPWSAELNGGFSRAPRDKLLRPPVESGPYGFPTLNVEHQCRDPASLLSFMKQLIHLRRANAWIGDARFEALSNDDSPVLVHRIHGGNVSFTAVHNLSGMPQDVTLQNDQGPTS
ncbi:MAG: alpha-amylase family glycosyl hydrolase, partial [Dehalococcoidia bacterium]